MQQGCFDDSRLQESFKKTATFFNPQGSKGKPTMEYTFKPQNQFTNRITSPVRVIKTSKPFSPPHPKKLTYQEQIKKIKEVDLRVELQKKERESTRLSSDQTEIPSYKRSLIESDRFNDLLKKSNSTNFLPQIQNKLQETVQRKHVIHCDYNDLLRKSKTAQEAMRETVRVQSPELPQINTQQGFSKCRSFLQRKPQAKIISRLFSSKSDNKNN